VAHSLSGSASRAVWSAAAGTTRASMTALGQIPTGDGGGAHHWSKKAARFRIETVDVFSTSLAHVERELLLPETPKETIMAHNGPDSGECRCALSVIRWNAGFTCNSYLWLFSCWGTSQ